MLSEEALLILSKKIAGRNLGGYRSATARGLPYYGKLRSKFPVHFRSFIGVVKRSEISGLASDFSRTPESLAKFIFHIGAIPSDMKEPTVGRFNHAKGYVIGNFAWQEKHDNVKESGTRNRSKLSDLNKGESHRDALLTEKLVLKMRAFWFFKKSKGYKKREVVDSIHKSIPYVSRATIADVLLKRTWRHL